MPKEAVGDACCDAVRGGRGGGGGQGSGAAAAAAPSPWTAAAAGMPLMFPARPSPGGGQSALARAALRAPAAGSRCGGGAAADKSDATTRTGGSGGSRGSGGDSCPSPGGSSGGGRRRLRAAAARQRRGDLSSSPRGPDSCGGASGGSSADSCGLPRWPARAVLSRPGRAAAGTTASWEQACEDHRAKVSRVKALVRSVVAWGPQVGHLVDLRTGARCAVTYWLREDVRALCIFDHEDTQVRVYACGQMERCEELSAAPEVCARQFFLGIDDDALGCGLMIVMERSAHSFAVMVQGHLGIFRAQLVLLLASRRQQQALLGALSALTAELVLRDVGGQSSGAAEGGQSSASLGSAGCWRPVMLSETGRLAPPAGSPRLCSAGGWRRLWPADAPLSDRGPAASEPLLPPPRPSTAR